MQASLNLSSSTITNLKKSIAVLHLIDLKTLDTVSFSSFHQSLGLCNNCDVTYISKILFLETL